MTIKPVFILSRGVGISIKPTGQLESIKDREEIRGRVDFLFKELESEVRRRPSSFTSGASFQLKIFFAGPGPLSPLGANIHPPSPFTQ
jgi:hypothetical protein